MGRFQAQFPTGAGGGIFALLLSPQLLKWSSAFSLYLRYLMFKLPHFSKRTTSVARYALDSHKTPVNIGLARLHALNPFTPAGRGGIVLLLVLALVLDL